MRALTATLAGAFCIGSQPVQAEPPVIAPAGPVTKPQPKRPKDAGHVAATTLAYRFKTGETHRYKIKAFFDGHFPPFAQPGSQPIHLMAEIVYVSKTGKQTPKGTEIAFTVETADLSLLTHEVALDEKINPDDQTPLPLITIEDAQKALNTTAVIRPDGTVASVVNSGANPVKVNIGFDLRKLFLLMMPITFPPKPVQVGDTWPGQDGVLGIKPDSTRYTNSLVRVTPNSRGYDYNLTQDAESKIDDTLDEQGNSTNKADAVFSTLKGNATMNGNVTFSTPTQDEAATKNTRTGVMVRGVMTMQVNLQRKTTKKDAPPEIVATTDGDIDVKARLLVRNDDAPTKPMPKAKKSAGNDVATNQNGPAKVDGQQ